MLDKLFDRVRLGAQTLIKASIGELKDQGHNASGRGIASFSYVVKLLGSIVVGQVYGNDYLKFVDTGTRPHRPPFSKIYAWAKLVKAGLSEKLRKKFAWSVVASIEKYGTPSPGSYKYSKNGRRTNWSKFAVIASEKTLDDIIEDNDFVETVIDNALNWRARV